MLDSSTRYSAPMASAQVAAQVASAPMALYALLLSSVFLGILLLFCTTPSRLHAEETQEGTVAVAYTVGTADGYCASTDVIAVPVTTTGTPVYFCFTIINSNPVTLTSHTFVIPQLGITNTFPSKVLPGGNVAVTTGYLASVGIVLTPPGLSTRITNQNVSSTVTVISIDEDGNQYTGQSTARIIVGQAMTAITQTVGTVEGSCADTTGIAVASGTPVYYCLTIADTGTLDFVRHEIRAPQIGATFVYTPANPALSPQQINAQLVRENYPPNQFKKDITAPFTNIITVTSYTADGIVAEGSAAAVAVVGSATATLTYTVGTNPTSCATTKTLPVLTNTTVYYCIQLKNSGTLPFERFTLSAPQLNWQRTLTRTLPAGGSMVLTSSFDSALAPLITDPQNTIINNAITVNAYTTEGIQVRMEGTVGITVGGLIFTVVKYARITPDGCVAAEPLAISSTTQFYYCVVIRNTGQVPITGFTLAEPAPAAINFTFDYQLGVGEAITLTNKFLADTLQIGSYLGPWVATGTINPSLTVTARGANGATVPFNDAFAINVTAATITPVPTLTPSLTWTPSPTPIPTTTPTVPPTPTATNVVLSILPTPTNAFGLDSVSTPLGAANDGSGGFVPDSPLVDSFLETPTPPIDFFATEVALTEVAAAALTFEAEATQSALLLTQQAPPPVPTETPTAPALPEASATPTETALPAVALPSPAGTDLSGVLLTPGPNGTGTGTGTGTGNDYLTLLVATFATSAATLGWLWFLVGSIIFFAVAGMFAGLGFRQRESRRYRIDDGAMVADEWGQFASEQFASEQFTGEQLDGEQLDGTFSQTADPFADLSFDADTSPAASPFARSPRANERKETMPPPRAATQDEADDDFWPASLP